MKVELTRNLDFGSEYQIGIGIDRLTASPEADFYDWLDYPTEVVVDIETWNGKHLVFDADDFEYNKDTGIERCDGEISDELWAVWEKVIETWLLMEYEQDFEKFKWAYTILAPMEYMLGQEPGCTLELMMLSYEATTGEEIDKDMLVNAV